MRTEHLDVASRLLAAAKKAEDPADTYAIVRSIEALLPLARAEVLAALVEAEQGQGGAAERLGLTRQAVNRQLRPLRQPGAHTDDLTDEHAALAQIEAKRRRAEANQRIIDTLGQPPAARKRAQR